MGKIYEHLELLGPRVLVRPLPDLGVTQGGLVLPDTGLHQQNRAIVEKVGPGDIVEGVKDRHPFDTLNKNPIVPARRAMSLSVGDLVLYQKFAGTWVVLDEQTRLMLLEDEVQGFVPAAKFTLVRHDDSEHLEGEPCLICLAPIQDAKNASARADLDRQRAELVLAKHGGQV